MVSLRLLSVLGMLGCASLASASPVNVATVSDELSRRDQLSKRCNWNDDYGVVDCGFFSVTFALTGDQVWAFIKGFSTGQNWSYEAQITCPGGDADGWQYFPLHNGVIPYIPEIHGADICDTTKNTADRWPNTWIKYADQQLNIVGDSRCGSVGPNGVGYRCLIAKNPS